jgi:predicted esterase
MRIGLGSHWLRRGAGAGTEQGACRLKTLLPKHQSLEALRAEPLAVDVPLSLPTSIPISGFEPAVVRFPDDRQASPLFVVTHGAGGQANWHCSHYADLLGPAAALLCPCGKRMVTRDPARGYYYPDHIALSGELSAVRAAVEEHSDLLQLEASVYIGYSQGASMGVLAVASHGDWWPRLALVEGGYDAWYPALAKQYHASGGQRVLFVCGTEHCRKLAAQAVTLLTRAGVNARLLTAPGAGHRPDGPVAARVREGLIWLLEGDNRFERVLNYVKPKSALNPANATGALPENP